MMKSIWLRRISALLALAFFLQLLPSADMSAGEDKIKVENVRLSNEQGKVVVYYDLAGPVDKEYEITLTLRREDVPSFEYHPAGLSGDVGRGLYGGKNRKIVWDVPAFLATSSENDRYYFVVDAEMMSSGISPLYWIAGAALMGGGAALFLFAPKSTETQSSSGSGFPQPPIRP